MILVRKTSTAQIIFYLCLLFFCAKATAKNVHSSRHELPLHFEGLIIKEIAKHNDIKLEVIAVNLPDQVVHCHESLLRKDDYPKFHFEIKKCQDEQGKEFFWEDLPETAAFWINLYKLDSPVVFGSALVIKPTANKIQHVHISYMSSEMVPVILSCPSHDKSFSEGFKEIQALFPYTIADKTYTYNDLIALKDEEARKFHDSPGGHALIEKIKSVCPPISDDDLHNKFHKRHKNYR